MKVGKAGPTTMVIIDGDAEGGRCRENEDGSWRDLPQ